MSAQPSLLSPVLAGVTAAVVGCGGAIAIVLSACLAVGATPVQTTSWIMGLCLAISASTALLSLMYRMPILAAWSTPGAVLIAASAGPHLTMATAVGAFVVTAGLIILTAMVPALSRAVERMPMPVAAAMLAAVLLGQVAAPFQGVPLNPWLILPLVVGYLLLRVWVPSLAPILVLLAGAAFAKWLGQLQPLPALGLATPVWIVPEFSLAAAVGLGVPLYLVTMASQNLAGFAVLRASGYAEVPARPILAVTGLASLLTAPLGAHTSNLAAISAAICTGPEAHPDPARRWVAGLANAAVYLVFAIFAQSLVAVFASLPPDLIKTVAGLVLAGPMIGALATAFGGEHDKFPPGLAFAVTASGVTFFGVGAAFWGLVAGVVALGVAQIAQFKKRM